MVSSFVAAIIISITFLVAYLCTRRPKSSSGINNGEYPAWFHKLSPAAQQIRLKEWNRQTGKVFTKNWFLKYWRGQRSAFHAWFTWFVVIGITTRLILFIISYFLQHSAAIVNILLNCLSVFVIIIAAIILWRCANNSTKFYKILSRIFAILPFVGLLLLLISIVFAKI